MLTAIITHTPLWVWGIFAYLIYRGILASQDRNLNISRIYIMPLIMLGLSVQGMLHAFSGNTWVWIWSIATLLSAGMAYRLSKPANIQVLPEPEMVRVRGSWMPMTLMMAIFITKYVVGATVAMHPEVASKAQFVWIVCAIYGVFNGMFLGPMLAMLVQYRRQKLQSQSGAQAQLSGNWQ
jgi:hypothetical protein